MRKTLLIGLLALIVGAGAHALAPQRVELHERLVVSPTAQDKAVALTLDACGGAFDADLIATLVARRIPATIFVTKTWLDRNPVGTAALLAHPELFELEDHGTQHVPAVIGRDARVYGLRGEPDVQHLQTEVSGAARAIAALTGRAPTYYRGATAIYDRQSMQVIESMGYRLAGFSISADAGATLPQAAVEARLRAVRPGDIILAHMNKPAGTTAEALALVLPELQSRHYHFVKLEDVALQAQ